MERARERSARLMARSYAGTKTAASGRHRACQQDGTNDPGDADARRRLSRSGGCRLLTVDHRQTSEMRRERRSGWANDRKVRSSKNQWHAKSCELAIFIWAGPAHRHTGPRRIVGLTSKPDTRPHPITASAQRRNPCITGDIHTCVPNYRFGRRAACLFRVAEFSVVEDWLGALIGRVATRCRRVGKTIQAPIGHSWRGPEPCEFRNLRPVAKSRRVKAKPCSTRDGNDAESGPLE